jgi:TatD DNase family protein
MLIDSHCHLDFSDFKEDMPLVLQRAKESGVGVMQTICTRLSRFPEVLALTSQEDNIYCSVGIHPHNVEEEPEFRPFEILEEIDLNQKIIGIGETGLDYFYDHSDREKQRASFVAHIEVARESGLPVIIHSRDADKDMIQIIKEESAKGTFPGVIHCFTAGYELAKAAVNCGLSISLSGIITFKNAEELRAVAKTLPIDHLLLETDAPFLAPVPCRGQRNEPSFLKHTAEFVSTMLDIDSCVLEEKTTGNFYRLFNRVKPDT